MYISRMALNTACPGAARLLSSPYRIHAAVEHAFPPVNDLASPEGRVLWRLDAWDDSPEVWLYVVSPAKPDFTHIKEQTGWPVTGSWETKDYSPVIDCLQTGQQWQFRLKANPVRKVKCDKGRRENPKVIGKVLGHVTESQQIDWLMSRCGDKGFSIVRNGDDEPLVRVSRRTKESFSRGSGKVTLMTCMFDGALEVDDPDALRHTLCWGMGRAKGFGCGLLTIAPLRRTNP